MSEVTPVHQNTEHVNALHTRCVMFSINTEVLPMPAGSAVSATTKLLILLTLSKNVVIFFLYEFYHSVKALFAVLTVDCQRNLGFHKMEEIYSLFSIV
jgi:hypothetical protein